MMILIMILASPRVQRNNYSLRVPGDTVLKLTHHDKHSNSSTTTLSSSVRSWTYENGRRYHAYREGSYVLPNDELEQDRLDMYHHIFQLILGGKLHICPLDNPQRILDIGTGTGAWAIDMADMYPEAEVIGNDLSPIQPRWVPPNLKFEVDDAEGKWSHQLDSFDLIHLRTMSGCFKDWDEVLTQVYKSVPSTPPKYPFSRGP